MACDTSYGERRVMSSPALRIVPSYNPANMPDGMKARAQWVCHKLQARGDGKFAKVPYDPRTGMPADVTDRATWAKFDEADAAASVANSIYDGLGFVFADDDGLFGIDLDDPGDDPVAIEQHSRICAHFDTYGEISQSGKGVHFIGAGVTPADGPKRRGKVEVYSRHRFFVMTGNVFRAAPIRECQPLLDQLLSEMAPAASASSFDASPFFCEATADDDTIYARAAGSANGDKFVQLWNGDGSAVPGADKSGSAIDMALVDILAFHTKDPAQIERLWLRSPQGQRDKTRTRAAYRKNTIARAFDREMPDMDFSAITGRIKAYVDGKKVAPHASVAVMPPGLLPTIPASDLAGRSVVPRSWHVADMVPARTVTLLGGDGGTGKSLAALQLAVATAAGLEWFGATVRQGGCLFVTAEDDIDEVHRRLADIAAALRMGLDGLPSLTLSSLAGRDAILAAPAGHSGPMTPTALYAALRGYIEAHRPALIVLDTLADLFGGEENNRAHVRQFVGLLRTLALDFDAAVLLLAHPSLTGMSSGTGLSGSTAWNNSVRSRLYLKRDPDDADVRILEMMKSNYGAIGQQVRLRWANGVFVEIGRTSNEPAHRVAAEALTDDIFLRLLAERTAQGQHLSVAPSSANYAPKLFAARPGVTVKKAGFVEAMTRLLAIGRIRTEMSKGPPSKQREIIVLATPGGDPASPPANLVPAYAGLPADPYANPPANLLPAPCLPTPIPP